MRTRPFAQVDVFSATPYRGNPVAVILDATDLTDDEMQGIARWTNLSETTFVLPSSQDAAAAGADYRVRIFTPVTELPFAGHPTLGTAHAWLENGGTPLQEGTVVQECGAGLVEISNAPDEPLSFTAPETTRSGPVSEPDLARICEVLRIDRSLIADHQWVVNGPQWVAVALPSAQDVLNLRPDFSAHPDLEIGVVGPYSDSTNGEGSIDYEVRAFIEGGEDPVTGSLNASIGQWLVRTGQVTGPYVASQGTVLQRSGRVQVTPVGGNVLIGGPTTTLFRGTVLA